MATEASIEKDLQALSLESLRDVATWTTGSFTVYDGVIPPPWTHLIAPDYPGFGRSDAPAPATFRYTFTGVSGPRRRPGA